MFFPQKKRDLFCSQLFFLTIVSSDKKLIEYESVVTVTAQGVTFICTKLSYLVLFDFTWSYLVLLGFAWFYLILIGFIGFTLFYFVLLGFTWFNRVLLGFT